MGITNINKEEETPLEKISILLMGWLCFDHKWVRCILFILGFVKKLFNCGNKSESGSYFIKAENMLN